MKAKTERSASPSGIHFYNLFQCCPRKGYIRFGPPRLEPLFIPTPLLLGSAFHAGKAVFYRSQKERSALATVRDELKARKAEFESTEEYLFALERAPAMLASWIAEFGASDLKTLNIIDVERSIRIPFPGKPSWHFTARIDMIAEDRFENLLVFETKSTSWSLYNTLQAVALGDQVTAYMWGASRHYKRRVTAVVPDITCWAKNSQRPEGIKNSRGDFVYRDDSDFEFFSHSTLQQASEISQKMRHVYAGGDPAVFPRNPYYCTAYGRACEFAEICRTNLTAKSRPAGFRKRPGKFATKETFEVVEDLLAGA